jgi:hypothetical protein
VKGPWSAGPEVAVLIVLSRNLLRPARRLIIEATINL